MEILKMTRVIFLCLAINFNLKLTHGFTVGVPPLRSVCLSMNPQHHEYASQGTESPYQVSVNANKVTGGDNVEFTLKSIVSTKKTKFIGFYVQARDENDSPIGTFIPNKDTKVHSCGGIRANAAHHASGGVKKENVTISWTAPKEFEGEVVFTATAVRDFVTYWVYLQTDPVMVTKSQVVRDSSGSSSTRRQNSSTSFNPQPNFGGGLRMFFQSLQTTANRLGSILIPSSRFRGRNDVVKDRAESSSGMSLPSASSSLANDIRPRCNLPLLKQFFCHFFQI